jgi:hypothetical protein
VASRFVRSPDIEGRHLGIGDEALLEVERGAKVSRPQGLASVAVPTARGDDLGDDVDGEAPGALEPQLVGGAREQLQEREAVAGGPVTQPHALAQRTGGPDELAAGQKQRVQTLPVRRTR